MIRRGASMVRRMISRKVGGRSRNRRRVFRKEYNQENGV